MVSGISSITHFFRVPLLFQAFVERTGVIKINNNKIHVHTYSITYICRSCKHVVV